MRRTISEYALGEYRILFDAGVPALALGSVVVLGALVRAGLVRARSWPAVLLVWSRTGTRAWSRSSACRWPRC